MDRRSSRQSHWPLPHRRFHRKRGETDQGAAAGKPASFIHPPTLKQQWDLTQARESPGTAIGRAKELLGAKQL